MTYSRRSFLRTSGGAFLGLAAARLRWQEDRESLGRIGLELYTVRTEMAKSVDRTLAAVAAIGYKEVEFAGYFGKSPQEIRSFLDADGLVAPSAHSADFPTMRTRWPETLDAARIMGHQYLVCASLPAAERRTADDYKRVAALLNAKGADARQAGLRLGYHNHRTEFEPLGDTCGYDVLLAECDPKLVTMQVDLYWMVKGGRDPLMYFAKYGAPGRFFSVHVKDMDDAGEMADVGAGRLPFARYLAAAKRAGVRYYYVERDDPSDPLASARASFESLRKLKF